MPNPPSDGGAQAIHHTTLGLLKNKISVDVLSINPSRNFIDPASLPQSYLDATSFCAVYVDTKIKLRRLLLSIFSNESYFVERFRSTDFENKLVEILSKNSYDIIQLEHLYLFLYIDIIRKHSNAKVVFRPQNVEYVIWERHLKSIWNPFTWLLISRATRLLKRFEQKHAGKADGIMALTDEDALLFSSFTKNIPVHSIPMGFVFDKLEGYDYSAQYKSGPVFYHLGSMDWRPNEEALKWFSDKILDRVVRRIPEVRFHIAGRKMQRYFYKRASKNLIVEGEIHYPIDYQKDKAVMIVPLLSGSGIRAKIVEGLALGKTIISTSIGAQGIHYQNGTNLFIADTPEEFTEQIVRCYSSPELCQQTGNEAIKLAKKKYHYEILASEMILFYKQILEARPEDAPC